MSPIIGLFAAIIAGWLAPRPRLAAAFVLPSILGATAAQSWYLGTGRGHNPASTTTNSPAYWVVQLLIIVAVCGVAAAVCWLRTRRSSTEKVTPSGSPLAIVLSGTAIAAFALTLGLMFATDRPAHPGSGNGNIPAAGAAAVVVGLIVLALLGINWLRRSRRELAQ